MNDSFIEKVKSRFIHPLPGRAAQTKMAPPIAREFTPDSDARIACVLALLYPKNDDWSIVLIERMSSKNKNDRHSGQISFPGGGYEDSDNSLAKTALREAEEEIGVFSKDISIIGQLSDMYIPVSNFLVHPFVAYMDYPPNFIPQPSEVKDILEIPIPKLLDPSTIQFTDLKISEGFTLNKVPYYSLNGHIVWGATAMMLSEFLEVVDV
jgi:8-oxo-dGTP pyrophosphatase MutT (NUDIX family)